MWYFIKMLHVPILKNKRDEKKHGYNSNNYYHTSEKTCEIMKVDFAWNLIRQCSLNALRKELGQVSVKCLFSVELAVMSVISLQWDCLAQYLLIVRTSFLLQFKWSRKGFIRTRWNVKNWYFLHILSEMSFNRINYGQLQNNAVNMIV